MIYVSILIEGGKGDVKTQIGKAVRIRVRMIIFFHVVVGNLTIPTLKLW